MNMVTNQNQQDLFICFFIACLVHGLLFLLACKIFVTSAVYETKIMIDVDLTALTAQQQCLTVPSADKKTETNQKQPIAPQAQPAKEYSANNSAGSTTPCQGICTQTIAHPCYLQNNPPAYPEKSLKLGQQGLVLLMVRVSCEGYALDASIKQSSGYVLLDGAAIKAVKSWTFKPARMGSVPIESEVEVPIRFSLNR
jgi:protein TonB